MAFIRARQRAITAINGGPGSGPYLVPKRGHKAILPPPDDGWNIDWGVAVTGSFRGFQSTGAGSIDPTAVLGVDIDYYYSNSTDTFRLGLAGGVQLPGVARVGVDIEGLANGLVLGWVSSTSRYQLAGVTGLFAWLDARVGQNVRCNWTDKT